MLRLAHRILSQGFVPEFYESERLHQGGIVHLQIARKLLVSDCPVIIADNVANYVNDCRRDGEGTGEKDFAYYPPMPPPFPYFFLEYNLPALHYPGNDAAPISVRDMQYSQEGVYMIASDDVAKVRNDAMLRKLYPDDISRARWSVTGGRFVTWNTGVVVPFSTYDVLLDEDGRCITSADRCLIRSNKDEGDPGAAVFLMTMAFLQCKNAKRLDATKDEGPPAKWCRRKRVPEVKYQVLQIDPNAVGERRPGERKTEGDRSGKSLHICRGHFVRYVDDGVSQGLFGRGIYGTFWIPAHVRGSLDQGKVVSTYVVKPPEDK